MNVQGRVGLVSSLGSVFVFTQKEICSVLEKKYNRDSATASIVQVIML